MRISRGKKIVAGTAVLAAALGGSIAVRPDDWGHAEVVFSKEAGTDVYVRVLMVSGSFNRVRSVVGEFDGVILTSYGEHKVIHKVLFPTERLTDLERLKGTLEAQGFEVDYALAPRLKGNSP